MAAKNKYEQITIESAYKDIVGATAEPQEEKNGRRTVTLEEAAYLRRMGKTRGHKGAHMKRMNIFITDENREYIEYVGKMFGRNMGEFINDIIADFAKKHPALLEQAKELQNVFNEDEEE